MISYQLVVVNFAYCSLLGSTSKFSVGLNVE